MNARQFACGIFAATLGFVAPIAAHAEPGITKNTIRIGQSAGVTGPVAGSVVGAAPMVDVPASSSNNRSRSSSALVSEDSCGEGEIGGTVPSVAG